MKELQDTARKIRDAVGRAYIAQRNGQLTRTIRRETDAEVRDALARHGWASEVQS